MFARHPRGLLAVRTGAPSGPVVVDVDPRGGGYRTMARLDAAAVLPGTVMQMTGGGLHLLYAHPGGTIRGGTNKLGPGVDVKADGGYFVAAPSRHPRTGEPYMWSGDGRWNHPPAPLHRLLVERLRPAPVRPPSRPPGAAAGRFRAAEGTPYNRLRGLVDTVLRAQQGERNAVLHWAACRLADMATDTGLDVQAAAEALARAGLDVGLTPSEVRATIASGRPAVRGVAA